MARFALLFAFSSLLSASVFGAPLQARKGKSSVGEPAVASNGTTYSMDVAMFTNPDGTMTLCSNGVSTNTTSNAAHHAKGAKAKAKGGAKNQANGKANAAQAHKHHGGAGAGGGGKNATSTSTGTSSTGNSTSTSISNSTIASLPGTDLNSTSISSITSSLYTGNMTMNLSDLPSCASLANSTVGGTLGNSTTIIMGTGMNSTTSALPSDSGNTTSTVASTTKSGGNKEKGGNADTSSKSDAKAKAVGKRRLPAVPLWELEDD